MSPQIFSQVSSAAKQSRAINPKTVLGFYATVLGLMFVTTSVVIGILASRGVRTDIIPWLLGFCAVIIVLLLAGVFIVTLVDPSKLMLTQVTGSEYATIQRVLVGDSLTGEKVELIAGTSVVLGLTELANDSTPRSESAAATEQQEQE